MHATHNSLSVAPPFFLRKAMEIDSAHALYLVSEYQRVLKIQKENEKAQQKSPSSYLKLRTQENSEELLALEASLGRALYLLGVHVLACHKDFNLNPSCVDALSALTWLPKTKAIPNGIDFLFSLYAGDRSPLLKEIFTKNCTKVSLKPFKELDRGPYTPPNSPKHVHWPSDGLAASPPGDIEVTESHPSHMDHVPKPAPCSRDEEWNIKNQHYDEFAKASRVAKEMRTIQPGWIERYTRFKDSFLQSQNQKGVFTLLQDTTSLEKDFAEHHKKTSQEPSMPSPIPPLSLWQSLLCYLSSLTILLYPGLPQFDPCLSSHQKADLTKRPLKKERDPNLSVDRSLTPRDLGNAYLDNHKGASLLSEAPDRALSTNSRNPSQKQPMP